MRAQQRRQLLETAKGWENPLGILAQYLIMLASE